MPFTLQPFLFSKLHSLCLSLMSSSLSWIGPREDTPNSRSTEAGGSILHCCYMVLYIYNVMVFTLMSSLFILIYNSLWFKLCAKIRVDGLFQNISPTFCTFSFFSVLETNLCLTTGSVCPRDTAVFKIKISGKKKNEGRKFKRIVCFCLLLFSMAPVPSSLSSLGRRHCYYYYWHGALILYYCGVTGSVG